jgi:L-ribulose-5-phosphate 3-epimerase
MNRREFLLRAGAGVGALGLGGRPLNGQSAPKLSGLPVYIFSKHLQFLDYEAMARTAAEIGFDGVDLTVRPGGHVEPEDSARDLPQAVSAVRTAGLKAETISTGLTRPNDPPARLLLEIAQKNGIRQYRVGMRKYRLTRPIETQLDEWVADISGLGAVNQSVGIQGAVQNHSRFFLGGLIWDLWAAIKDTDGSYLGCHYDVSHAVAEAAISWPVGFHLLKSRISALIVKDFDFTQSESGLNRRWVPLGEGKVPWDRFWPMVGEAGLNVPVILHMEYGDRNAPEQSIAFLRRDLKTLRSMLAGSWRRS